jgi:23S rRNA A2030 N6-methylase RlmJ
MATSTSISTSLTAIPAELQPYITKTYSADDIAKGNVEGILPTAQKLLTTSYDKAYGNPMAKAGLAGSGRVAGISPMTTQVGNELGGMRTPEEYAQATGAVNLGLGALEGMTNAGATREYMSPYIQNVLNVNKKAAMRDAQRNLLSQNLAAGRTGSYGASGNILAQAEAQRNFQTKLAEIQAAGMQNAFEDARKAQVAQAAGYTTAGNTLASIGTTKQASDIDRIKTQGAYGDLQRGIQQNQLDAQYQDLMAKLNYPITSLETMNNLVRGVPLAKVGETSSTTTPPPSFASQLGGMGLSGLGLLNMLK